jgi:hypothetical protein
MVCGPFEGYKAVNLNETIKYCNTHLMRGIRIRDPAKKSFRFLLADLQLENREYDLGSLNSLIGYRTDRRQGIDKGKTEQRTVFSFGMAKRRWI